MKRILSSLFIIAVCVLVSPAVYAHQYESNGTIGSFLHIVPDHKPQSDVPTKMIITFNDKNNQFNLKDCDCKVTADYKGKQFMAASIPVGTGLKADIPITFPEPGEGYLITVTGAPKNGANFEPFQFEYDEVTVLQGPHQWTFMQVAGAVSAIGILVLLLTGVYLYARRRDAIDAEK